MSSSTPKFRLENQVALVTGGASGIGYAITETFLREGAKVFVVDFSPKNIQSAQQKLKANRVAVTEDLFQMHEADASTDASVKAFVDACVQRFGRLDIAILNAGIGLPPKPILDYEEQDFDKIMAINARGPFLGIKYAARKMKELGTPGKIVATCSTAGLRARPTVGMYTMSKWAVRGLVITAAIELGKDNIRVNAVCPGIIDTPILEVFGTAEDRVKTTPIARMASPFEVAKVFLFLASDESSFVTGSMYRVDGGSCHF